MKVVFAFNEGAAGWFRDMIKVLVKSCQANTSLELYCLYDGARSTLTDWLRKNNVQVISARAPFYLDLFSDEVIEKNSGTSYSPYHASGTFLKTTLPNHFGSEQILFTDCDVMFVGNPNIEESFEDEWLQACSEVDVNEDGKIIDVRGFNAGVLTFNPQKLRGYLLSYQARLKERGYFVPSSGSYEQTILNEVTNPIWKKMPSTLNWRPFQGVNTEASIIHFHGPKPSRIAKILEGTASPEEKGLEKYIRAGEQGYRHYLEQFESYLKDA